MLKRTNRVPKYKALYQNQGSLSQCRYSLGSSDSLLPSHVSTHSSFAIPSQLRTYAREPCTKCVYACSVASVISNSLQPCGLQPSISSVLGIFQARILEQVAMPSSRGSSQPRDQPRSPTLQVDSLLSEPPGKPF